LPKNTLKTDDGVQAMERLKSRILLVLIGLTAGPVLAQQSASSPPPAGFVAVVGDVARCDNYPIPANSPLTVRQAVQNAGIVSDTVNVKVIRATQDRAQFTQVISANSADNGEPVENGDVLLVQSMSPMKVEVRKNAALRTDSGVIVVGLEENGIRIGDVLLYAHATPPMDGQIKVISRFQGQPPIAKAELYSPTLHGDVISISHDNRRVLEGFGNMAPAVSEWKSQSAALPRSLTSATSSYTGADFSLSNGTSNPQPFEFPASPADTMFLPGTGDDTPDSNGFATDADDESSTSSNALPISQSEDVADIANETTTGNKISFASESVAIAPVAPAEIKTGIVTAPKSSNFNPWNLVFVGGLLLAGTLILAGTLRPDPDDNGKFIETAVRESIANSKRFNSTPNAPQTPTASAMWQTNSKAALPTENSEEVMKSPIASAGAELKKSSEIQTVTPAPTANSLVASHERFSGDWNGRVVQNNDIPNETTANVDSIVTVAIPEAPASQECLAEIQKTESSTKSVTEELLAADEIVNDTTAREIASAIADIVASAAAVTSADVATNEIEDQSETAGLEDLLQNRLPIDLCEAQLPLRIALFGTPTGPRRLRIDAAHKTVPASHINLTADKRREQQVTATASAAATQSAATQSAATQSAATQSAATQSAATQSAPKPSTADSSGGLDRALHFLQERTES